ncbi:MAG: hypothetical protein II735_06615 [Clostridia bacterium]|nr:hypothetical protein [Clostridia bacterium]
MVILATMALVWGVVAIGAAFLSHLRDYSGDVYDKVEKSRKPPKSPQQKAPKDQPPQS